MLIQYPIETMMLLMERYTITLLITKKKTLLIKLCLTISEGLLYLKKVYHRINEIYFIYIIHMNSFNHSIFEINNQ